MTETLHIADLEFEIRRGPRRKTLGLTVDRAGELVVHAPVSASEDELFEWVNRKLLWVYRKLALKEEMNSATRSPEFVSGESFFYLGKSYRLRVVDNGKSALHFDGEWFHLRRKDQSTAREHFRKWYMRTGTPWIVERVSAWEPRVNAKPPRVMVGDLGFNWGSCGKNGAIYFNWRLLQLPVRLIDYIVVHEMAHLIEHNHTREFWKILDRAMPDWQERKKTMESVWKEFAVFNVDKSTISR
jgi:predicted metal-dependent hydrolase